MSNLPGWVTRVSGIWVGIGTLIVLLGSQGVNLPGWTGELFSQTFVDEVLKLVGVIINFLGFAKLIFASKKAEGDVQILSAGQKNKFMFNPFKVTL